MRRKNHLLLLFCLALFTAGCQSGKETANEYNLIPLPNHLTPQEGRFKLTGKVKVIIDGDIPEVQTIAGNFVRMVEKTSGISMQMDTAVNIAGPVIRFTPLHGMGKEEYILMVSPEVITILATQPNGFFYAVQTLCQLLPPAVYGQEKDSRAEWSVPAVEIRDAPRFEHRGLMLDVCRHFSSIDYVYKFIDLLAMHKMNVFHFHLTDDQGWRIEIKKYPGLINTGSRRKETLVDYYFTNYPQLFDGKEYGSFYFTQEQIKDIVAYAADRYITVIPEIEMPGHASAALAAYPKLGCNPEQDYKVQTTWGVFDEVFCPKEETFAFLEDVIDEVIELFPASYIHIGGDECPKTAWKNCAHCQALISKLGLREDKTPNPVDGKLHSKEEKLQSYFISRMEKYINSKGKNIIGWDEILEGGLAPNATVMSWRGESGGINAAKTGHDVIMTPNSHLYLDQYQENPELAPTTIGGYTTLKKIYSYNPVPEGADDLLRKHVKGLQGNIWTEYMQNDERRDYQAFPRAVAIAETAWTDAANKSWDSFRKRMVEEFERLDKTNTRACRNFFDVNIDTRVDESRALKAVLETFYPGADIYYTTDGSAPTPKSTKYKEPFGWKGKIDLCAATFKKGKMLGKVSSKALYQNLISGKSFETKPVMGWMQGDVFGENDVLGDNKTTFGLTNGKRGYAASYTPWTLFRSLEKNNDEVEFIVRLEPVASVREVVFGSLYNPAFSILPPSAVVVETSMDGDNYTVAAEESFTRQYPEHGREAYTDTVSFAPVKAAAYLKIRFKSGGTIRNGIDCRPSGNAELLPSGMALDEIEVYQSVPKDE